jgi:hypothetical protein
MSTTTRAEASRQNGSKSHGPTTEEGKAKSSRNGIKHGLFASLGAPIDEREAEMSTDFQAALMSEYAPQTVEQLKLVVTIVKCECRLLRISTLESSIYAVKPNDEEDQNLFYSRLVTTLTKVTRIEKNILQTLRETKEELDELRANSLPEVVSKAPSPEFGKFQNEPKPTRDAVPRTASTSDPEELKIGYPTKVYKNLQKRSSELL